MKAIQLKGFGGIENLVAVDAPMPTIEKDEVLIQSRSISINPIDIKTRLGKGIAASIKNNLPAIIGWDIAGVVIEVGSNVGQFKVGDEVFGFLHFPKPGKTYAEYVAAPASQLSFKPTNVSHNEAAATTLAALTAWQALTLHAKINVGDRVLIHAAAGGVGHFAVQLAKHLGAYVMGTASLANKNFVLGLGADEHIDYKAQPFESKVKDIDFVLDTIGGEYIDRSLKVMKKGGTIISIPSGANETVTEKAIALGINGAVMKVQPNGKDMQTMAGFLAHGIVKPRIFRTYPFDKMGEAHQQIEGGRTVGKITLAF